MKTLLICFTLLISIYFNAQSLDDWQIGVNANPFIFQRFRPSELPVRLKQDFPNGFATGITIEKSLSEKWSIESGVNLSWQNDRYTAPYGGTDVFPMLVIYHFQYYKIPLKVNYYIPLKNNFYFNINQGFQLSLLSKYIINYEDNQQIGVYENDLYIFESKINGIHNEFNINWMFKKNTLGLTGGFGLKKIINTRYSFSTNIKYEYDFTNSQISDLDPTWGNESKNFRIGLDLGIQYHFNLKNNRQSRCPE